MAEKDVLYHELREALEASGCAFCRLARRASDSYLNALIHEGITDPDLRDKLRDARGLCYRHAWRIAHRRGSVLGVAIIYRDVVNTVIKALESEEAAVSRWRSAKPSLSDRLAATRECPACELERDAERRAAKTLLKHVDDDAVAASYVAGGGLCLPHFRLTLSHAGAAASRKLAVWQVEPHRQLRDELDELIRKHDYRFGGEPITDDEADSWQRAVAGMVGEPEPPSRD
jgi:hypothetical protein